MGGYVGSRAVNLSTTAVDVSGNATIGGNLTVSGTTVTIDSANAQTVDLGDNDKIRLGDGDDLQIYHDGSTSFISDQGTGNLKILAQNFIVSNPANTETMIAASPDGAVSLYYDAAAKLATTSTGIDVTGNATFADNGKAIFGAGSDLQIYHDGSNSYIDEQGTGSLNIRSSATLRLQNASGTNFLYGTVGGEVVLYYDGNAKLTTGSTGVDVTGRITTDGITSSGTYVVESTSYFVGNATNGYRFNNAADTSNLLVIKDSGNVGIGESNPQAKLEVNGIAMMDSARLSSNSGTSYWDIRRDSSTGHLVVKDDGLGDVITVSQASGNVGIGATPSQPLHIEGTTASSGDARSNVIIADDTSFAAGVGGGIVFRAKYNTAGSFTNMSSIQGIKENGTDGNFAGALTFTTRANGASNAEAMRIDSSGNVGIGDSSPANTLSVIGASTTGSGSTGNVAEFAGPSNTNGFQVFVDDSGNNSGIQTKNGDGFIINPHGGNVFIGGTSADSGNLLTVYGSDAAAIFQSSTTGTGSSNGFTTGNNGTVNSFVWNYENGFMQFGTNNAERMRIASTGEVGIGDAGSASYQLTILTGAMKSASLMGRNTDSSLRSHVVFYSQNQAAIVGQIKISNSATSYVTSSDYRLKENVETLSDGINRVKQLKPKRFSWICENDSSANVDGFIAHEAATVVPEAVSGEKDAMTEEVLYVEGDEIPEGKEVGDVKTASTIDPQGIDHSKLVPLLTAALQEAIAKIETLETKVAALEG